MKNKESVLRLPRALGAIASALALAVPACGSDAVQNVDAGVPLDAASYTTVCADGLKRCAAYFTYRAGGEASVELRGDYRPGAWVKGDGMARVGDVWQVTVQIPWSRAVEYKLFINGSTWVTDPAQPVDAATGNNVAAARTCLTFLCDPAPPPAAPPAGPPDAASDSGS